MTQQPVETPEQRRRRLQLEGQLGAAPQSPTAVLDNLPAEEPTASPTGLLDSLQEAPERSSATPALDAFNEEQRRSLELQQRFAETSTRDIAGQQILDPLARFSRTGSGAILQALSRSGVPLDDFDERVKALREQGAGRLESLRLAQEQSDLPFGVKGATEFLADPTLVVPGLGIVGGVGKQAIKVSGKEIVKGLTRDAARTARIAASPEFPRGVIGAAAQVVEEVPEAAARTVSPTPVLDEAAASLVPEQLTLPEGQVAKPPTPPKDPDFSVSALPEQPEDVLSRIQRQRTPGEQPAETLLRRHEASINAAGSEARVITDEGSQGLREIGIGRIVGGRLAPRAEDIPQLDELFKALHSPSEASALPESLRPHFERLRELTDWEEAARIDFDPAMATVDDYFYRGWKAPEGVSRGSETGRGRVGARPSFKFPRKDATYSEMREAGFEPLFWNPYEQWRASRLMGVRSREQRQLISDLKELGIAKPDAGGVGIEGWRTPEIGPAFQGKPFSVPDTDQVAFTHRWLIPDEMANRLENIYGKSPNLGKIHVGSREIDILKIVDAATFIPKRAKLFGSFFQQQDFLTRSLIGSWTKMVDDLVAGKPVSAVKSLAVWPKSAVEILQANIGPGARLGIRKTLNSSKPLLPNRPGIHFKGIMEAGLSNIDVTLLPQDIDKVVRLAAEDAGVLGVKRVGRVIGDIEGAMRRGLFEGVYPAAQITDIRNNIAPMLARKFPELSDEALNGMIARTTNIKYSTIPASQSIFQNRFMREVLRRVFFSIGESEGLLRQAGGAIKGPNTAFWRKHFIGAYLGLLATANAIHFASTGKPLPFDRYSPISKNRFGPLPFGYNRDFAAPNIPLTGRSGTEIVLDVVGQMDTALRILDPIAFLTSRESVPVRAFENQFRGEDFFGRPIDTVGPGGIVSRTAQLVNDLFQPIGVGNIARAFRESIPGGETLIPEAESRLGRTGQLAQTLTNLRAETTPDLLDKAADAFRPGATWSDLSSDDKKRLLQLHPRLQRELDLRAEQSIRKVALTSEERGIINSIRRNREERETRSEGNPAFRRQREQQGR